MLARMQDTAHLLHSAGTYMSQCLHLDARLPSTYGMLTMYCQRSTCNCAMQHMSQWCVSFILSRPAILHVMLQALPQFQPMCSTQPRGAFTQRYAPCQNKHTYACCHQMQPFRQFNSGAAGTRPPTTESSPVLSKQQTLLCFALHTRPARSDPFVFQEVQTAGPALGWHHHH
jgi:hypothetical protein